MRMRHAPGQEVRPRRQFRFGRWAAATMLAFWVLPGITVVALWDGVLRTDNVVGCTTPGLLGCNLSSQDTLRLWAIVFGPYVLLAGVVVLVGLALVDCLLRMRTR